MPCHLVIRHSLIQGGECGGVGGEKFKDGESLKTEGAREGRVEGCLQRGVMMMHGNTRANSPRLSPLALSSLFYRSISDCASLPPSLWRFISPGRCPQGSSHLCLRSLSESAFPCIAPFFLSFTASHLTFCFLSYHKPLLSSDVCIYLSQPLSACLLPLRSVRIKANKNLDLAPALSKCGISFHYLHIV